MPLGTEVNLGPGDVVLDGVAAPPKRGAVPQFASIVTKRLDGDTTWYGSRPRPRPHCIRRRPTSPRKGHSSPPLFGPCLLWSRSPISATAELLLRSSRQKIPILYNGRPYPPEVPLRMGIWTPSKTILWVDASPKPKRNLDQFSRFCTDDRRVSLLYNGSPVSPF